MNAPGEPDAAGLPERAELADRPDPDELPELAGLSEPADLPELVGLPELADLPDPTGLPDPAGPSEPADETALARAVLETIREASAEPRLIGLEEILAGLRERGLAERLETSPPDDPCTALAAIVAQLPEIAPLASRSGRTLYHDPARLSRSYARLLDNQDAPEALLAEAVRSNSRDYPRPVPVEFFEKPPFDLAPKDVAALLEAMAAKPQFQDIATIRTSTGTAYLFSSLHLTRAYAAFLAEQDATQAMNP